MSFLLRQGIQTHLSEKFRSRIGIQVFPFVYPSAGLAMAAGFGHPIQVRTTFCVPGTRQDCFPRRSFDIEGRGFRSVNFSGSIWEMSDKFTSVF